jgi:hypothetical protein
MIMIARPQLISDVLKSYHIIMADMINDLTSSVFMAMPSPLQNTTVSNRSRADTGFPGVGILLELRRRTEIAWQL